MRQPIMQNVSIADSHIMLESNIGLPLALIGRNSPMLLHRHGPMRMNICLRLD